MVAVAVLALLVLLLKPVLFGPPSDVPIIDVSADMGGFDRPVIRVRAGEPVTIRLRSLDDAFHIDGGGRHQFAVDELGVDIVAGPKATAFQTFTPQEPGAYTFYCDVCCGGRANPSMSGRLIVVG